VGGDGYFARHEFDAQYKGVFVSGDFLKYPRGGGKWPVADCEAVVARGADLGRRISFTRVAVGTVIYPGVGTIVGALATKNRNKIYLAIYVPGDVVLIELPAKKETRAIEFAL